MSNTYIRLTESRNHRQPSLGLTIFLELHLEEVAPRFEEIKERQTAADSRP